jgi:hypothetical protein
MRCLSSGDGEDDDEALVLKVGGSIAGKLLAGDGEASVVFSLFFALGIVGVYTEAGSVITSSSGTVATVGISVLIFTLSVTASTPLDLEARIRTVFKGVGGRGLVGTGPLLFLLG